MRDIAHLLRPGHLAPLAKILDDPEASANDRFVALELLQERQHRRRRACCPPARTPAPPSSRARRASSCFTGGGDEAAIARGVFDTYLTSNLRYCQMAALDMYEENNTGTNLPAEIEIYAVDGDAYKFLFMAKGGGSANKSYLYQETKALLNPGQPGDMDRREDPHARHRGLPAVPPGHRHRRNVGGVHDEDRQAGLGPLPRHAAQDGQRAWARLPRRGARGGGAEGLPGERHRRPVRRQVLLPRRAHHPPAPPRRLLPGGHRRQLLGRPPGDGQDHREGVVPRAAGDRPGEVPARTPPQRTSTARSSPSI